MASRRHGSLEGALLLLALLALAPAALLLLALALHAQLRPLHWVTLATALAGFHGWLALRAWRQLLLPWYRLTNLVEALRLEDYSLRASTPYARGIGAALFGELGALADVLARHKRRYDQHVLLLHSLIEQLDSPVLVFDGRLRLVQANPAADAFLGCPRLEALGRGADELGLESDTAGWRLLADHGRWHVRSSSFESAGRRHHLLLLSDIRRELDRTESQAWQRIVRVLTHEIRNSLTPIRSLAQGLAETPTWDPQQGTLALRVIGLRSDALLRFVESYGALARLAPPQPGAFPAAALIDTLRALHGELHFAETTPGLMIAGDRTQIEQLLLNLLRNAIEAGSPEASITTEVSERLAWIAIVVSDRGTGIANGDNLFVPFYTTKKGGSGIGLALSRQIARNHGGELTLRNRDDGPGARAELLLPRVRSVPREG